MCRAAALYASALGRCSAHVVHMLTLCAVKEMVAAPYETKSDSFYFVDGKLVMHNRADYNYGN